MIIVKCKRESCLNYDIEFRVPGDERNVMCGGCFKNAPIIETVPDPEETERTYTQ